MMPGSSDARLNRSRRRSTDAEDGIAARDRARAAGRLHDQTDTQDILLKVVQIVVAVLTFIAVTATFTRWSTPAIVTIGIGVISLSIAIGLYSIRGGVSAIQDRRGTHIIIALLVLVFTISIALVSLGLVPSGWPGAGATVQQLIFVSAGAIATASFVGAAWWAYQTAQRGKTIINLLEEERQALESRRLATEALLKTIRALLDNQPAATHQASTPSGPPPQRAGPR